MVEVDGDVMLDDGAAWPHGAARTKGPGTSREGATREGPATQERRRSRHFMLGRELGRESALLLDLAAAWSAGGAVR
jgi:hypothetical protein